MAQACLKIFIVILALLELLSGLCITGLAAAIRGLLTDVPVEVMGIDTDDPNVQAKYTLISDGVDIITRAATGVIAFGMLMMVSAMLGLYGACCEVACLLYLYMPVMALLAVVDLVVGSLILIGRKKVVEWFSDSADCEACARIISYLTKFAVPAAGVTLFSALPKVFAVYCAWRIIAKLKEKHQDKKIMRNFLRGHQSQSANNQPVVIQFQGASAPPPTTLQNNVTNFIQPGFQMMPMNQQTNSAPAQFAPNPGNAHYASAHAQYAPNSVPAPPPPPPIGGSQKRPTAPTQDDICKKTSKTALNANRNDNNEKQFSDKFNTELNIRPQNPTPDRARKYNDLNDDYPVIKRHKALSNVMSDFDDSGNERFDKLNTKKVKVLPEKSHKSKVKVNDHSQTSEHVNDVFSDHENDSQIIVNRTRLSSLPSEYRKTFGSGTSGVVSVVEEEMK